MERDRLSPTQQKSFDKIVNAAQFLFDKTGIENTTIKDIAEESGLSRFTVYNLFNNKEGIITSVVLDTLEDMYSELEVVNRDGYLFEELKRFFHDLLDIYLEKDYALRVLIAYYRENETSNELEEVLFRKGTAIGNHKDELKSLFLKHTDDEKELDELDKKFYTVFNFVIGIGMRYSSRKGLFIGNELNAEMKYLHEGLDCLLELLK